MDSEIAASSHRNIERVMYACFSDFRPRTSSELYAAGALCRWIKRPGAVVCARTAGNRAAEAVAQLREFGLTA